MKEPVCDLKALVQGKYKVTYQPSWFAESGSSGKTYQKHRYYEIKGRRGILYPWDLDHFECFFVHPPSLEGKYRYTGSHQPRGYPSRKPLAMRFLNKTGWIKKNEYDESMSFIVDNSLIFDACTAIKAKRKRSLSPETRKKAIERLARINSTQKRHA